MSDTIAVPEVSPTAAAEPAGALEVEKNPASKAWDALHDAQTADKFEQPDAPIGNMIGGGFMPPLPPIAGTNAKPDIVSLDEMYDMLPDSAKQMVSKKWLRTNVPGRMSVGRGSMWPRWVVVQYFEWVAPFSRNQPQPEAEDPEVDPPAEG